MPQQLVPWRALIALLRIASLMRSAKGRFDDQKFFIDERKDGRSLMACSPSETLPQSKPVTEARPTEIRWA